MAIQHVQPLPYRPVTVWIPNEVEDQNFGGNFNHVSVTAESCFVLTTYATRQGLDWLVRRETQILYTQAVYSRPRDRIGSISPDCFVAPGVHLGAYEPYNLEQVGSPPVLVIEIISKKTQRRDKSTKVQAYADMGVEEYVLFDPRPRKKLELFGYRLAGVGNYLPMPSAPEGGLWLASIGLRVIGEPESQPDHGNQLRFYTRTGERLLFTGEEAATRIEERQAREHAEQGTWRAQQEAQRPEQEAQRPEQETRRAEQERDAERARAARLEALLAEHGIVPGAT